MDTPPRTDMNAVMLDEIARQHTKAQQATKEAREAMASAINQALVEKSQRHHKSNIHDFLSPVMNGIESRAYMTTAKAAKNRPISNDKRVLQALGLMDKQPSRKAEFKTRAKPGLTSHITKANVAISHALQARPITSMTKGEREQIKAILEPLARVYVELSKP